MDIYWECLDWYVLVLCFNWDKVGYVSIDFFFFLRRNRTYYAGTKHYMQEKQFLQKQKQGNHTNSTEIETLCKKIIFAENKTKKSHLFYRDKNIVICLKLYTSLDDDKLSFDCLKKLVTKHCIETHSIKGKKKKP